LQHYFGTTLLKGCRPLHYKMKLCSYIVAQWGIWTIWAAKSRFSKNQRRWNTKLPDKHEQCQNKRLPLLSPSAPPRRHTISRNWAFTIGARIFAERSVRKRDLKGNMCCRVVLGNTWCWIVRKRVSVHTRTLYVISLRL
jgi:hypothetical protein